MITPTGVCKKTKQNKTKQERKPIAKLILFEVEFGDLKWMYNQEPRNVAQARKDQNIRDASCLGSMAQGLHVGWWKNILQTNGHIENKQFKLY